MSHNSKEQLSVLKENLRESGSFASPEETTKAYKALDEKFQCLVREYYRQDEEFREVSRYLVNQLEMLSQENHRLYMENTSLAHRHTEMLQRLETSEGKRYQKGVCLPSMMRTRHAQSYNGGY